MINPLDSMSLILYDTLKSQNVMSLMKKKPLIDFESQIFDA